VNRVLFYTDEPVLARGLASILLASTDFADVGVCTTMAEVHAALRQQEPDILLLDLTPEVSYTALSEIKRATHHCRTLLWAHVISPELAFQAMGLGIRGILRKTLTPDLVLKCLKKVSQGELWYEKALTDSFLAAKRVSLTRREGQLVALLAQGLKNKEIAARLLITEGTVKVYLSKLFQKVGVKDRFELALFGVRNMTTGGHPVERADAAGGLDFPLNSPRSLVLDRRSPMPIPPPAAGDSLAGLRRM
jgi:DNA-binding NarL/FixJ family response regulator